ncbi:MAG: hypothetical protein ACLUSP_02515 [Christensenellales bacterium]
MWNEIKPSAAADAAARQNGCENRLGGQTDKKRRENRRENKTERADGKRKR